MIGISLYILNHSLLFGRLQAVSLLLENLWARVQKTEANNEALS